MRIARYTIGDDPAYGVVRGEGPDAVLLPLQGDPLYVGVRPAGGAPVPLDEARLLAPVIPRSKVVGIGRNYADHARELGNEVPAVIIGRTCKDVDEAHALAYVAGYTCANDVSARNWQRSDGQWARAKGFDTSCPLGPWIETELDPAALRIRTRRDGEVVQDGTTADMVHGVAALIAYASAAFTLLPGDVILTGTPAGVGPVEAGQRVTVDIEGIGVLDNPFVRRR